MATITGTDASDFLVGTADADLVNGGLGNDTIRGLGGNDTLNGAEGSDDIDGGDGNDYLIGGAGDDTIQGGMNADTIEGGAGNDVLRGGKGFDSIDGGDGNDTIYSGLGQDTLTGGDGADVFVVRGDDPNFPGALKSPTITDFVAGTDTIAIQGATADEITTALTAQTTVDGGVSFSINGATIVVKGTGLTSLTSTNVVVEGDIPEPQPTGSVFTLTTSADTLSPTSATASTQTTAGADTIRAPQDGLLQTVDFIDAGAGDDTLTASVTSAGQTLAPVLQNVEKVFISTAAVDANALTLNAADMTGIEQFWVQDAESISNNANDERITVSNLAKTATFGIKGGSGTGTSASDIKVDFADVAAADTQKIALDNGLTALLTLSTAETVEITSTGTDTKASKIESLAATAVKTLNLKGSGDVTISASDLAASVTIDASASTGKVTFTGDTAATSTTFNGGTGATSFTTASTGTVKVTTQGGDDTINISGGNSTATISTGAGDDRVLVGDQANITAADSIDGGEGYDTIAVSNVTLNGATKTALTGRVTNFERAETTAMTAVTIDYNALSMFNDVRVSGAMAVAAAGANTAGANSVTATMENDDSLLITAARGGQTGGVVSDAVGKDGGHGIAISPRTDGGSNVATLTLRGNADITGGNGGAGDDTAASTAQAGGDGGDAVNAANIETLNIVIQGTQTTAAADTVTFAAGTGGAGDGGGAAGSAGVGMTVGTNATVNISSTLLGTATKHNNLDMGTVKGTNVTISAANFEGNLTVTTVDGNTTITSGKGNDVLTGGAGIDVISGGAGNDQITGGDGADQLTGGDGRDAFIVGTAGHSDTTAYDKISDFGKITEAATAAEVNAMNNFATFTAAATAKGGAGADYLDLATAATLGGAQTGVDVSAAAGGGTITASESAKGIITVTGADAANVDTLAEWVAVATTMAVAGNNVVAFEFGGNTYVFQNGATDDLIELTGVTGVTGIALAGTASAAAVGDIFVLGV